ncbi:hypothetical protein HPG69_006227 [Diceros bicornis minor]|uniref:Uncharacterized protein n=1 Tax=Diceros bicornis minor TaxID=77932 RepID=A0A7J7F272_DICBM|nr:hypothetical protein HPG69_006227 [Diceros bicornis minor]
MYYFLAVLSLTDMEMSITAPPAILKIFWYEAREIETNACSFDYSSKFTTQCIIRLGVFILIRRSLVLPVVLVCIPTFSFRLSHVLSHSFCLHQDVIWLARAVISFNILYGLFVVVFYWGVDTLGIFLSYAFIFHSVLGIASQGGNQSPQYVYLSHLCCAHSVCANDRALLSASLCKTLLAHYPPKHGQNLLVSSTINPMATLNSSYSLSSTFYLTAIVMNYTSNSLLPVRINTMLGVKETE